MLIIEIIDFGFPQNTDPETIKLFVTSEDFKKETKMITEGSKATMQATGATSWRRTDIKYKKNEIFIDVIENVNLLMSSSGNILRADVNGKVMLKSLLSGNPECKIGLNEKALMDAEASNGMVQTKQKSTRQSKSVAIDDYQFHQCVKLGKFESDKTITFVPPDGEFELMR